MGTFPGCLRDQLPPTPPKQLSSFYLSPGPCLAPPTCFNPAAVTPSCLASSHLHPQAAQVKLVSTPYLAAHRSKLQVQVPSLAVIRQLLLCPQSEMSSRFLQHRDQDGLYPGISLGDFCILALGASSPASIGPAHPLLPQTQGSACLINEVPWQPRAGRVADGSTGRGRGSAAGPAPLPCREGLPATPEVWRARRAPGRLSRQEGLLHGSSKGQGTPIPGLCPLQSQEPHAPPSHKFTSQSHHLQLYDQGPATSLSGAHSVPRMSQMGAVTTPNSQQDCELA